MPGSGLSLRCSPYQSAAGLLLSVATRSLRLPPASCSVEMKEKADLSRSVFMPGSGLRLRCSPYQHTAALLLSIATRSLRLPPASSSAEMKEKADLSRSVFHARVGLEPAMLAVSTCGWASPLNRDALATPSASARPGGDEESADRSRSAVCIHAGARPETDIVRTTGWILTTHSCLERNPSPFLDMDSGFAPFFRRRHTKVADFHLS